MRRILRFMALIIPPGWLQALYVLTLTGDNEAMIVTCGHKIDDASGATIDQAANDLHTAFSAQIRAGLMQNPYTFSHVVAYIGNDGPPTVRTSTLAPAAGAGGSSVVPSNTAYLIRKRTDLAGRRGRGRFYLPGVPESVVNEVGDLTPAQQTAGQATVDAWYGLLATAVGARLYPPAVLHRSEGAGIEPLPTLVTKFVMEKRVATQRRRMRP